jgi:hypothetical protein
MKAIQLSLVPTPNAKPEFLATVEPLEDLEEWKSLPSKVNLEGYTRDSWAWKPSIGNWVELVCISVDGRNKLPGFIKYLKDRQKSAFGRFSPTSVWVVSYIQKKTASANEISIRLCFNTTQLQDCPFNKSNLVTSPEHSITKSDTKVQKPQQSLDQPKNKKSGLLGNLLGATNRTNKHMETSAKLKPLNTATSSVIVNEAIKTAQQVLSEFRQKMEDEMLDFDTCGEGVLKIKIVLADMQKGLSDEDKARITMKAMEYIVSEAAEECNENWITHKEASEFMDECVVAVYKEGHAPDEVVEEINRVELTEDMRGEQFAIQEAIKRKQAAEEAKFYDQNFKKAIKENEDVDLAALNTNKRDRRTIEEIQLGVVQPDKKRRQ